MVDEELGICLVQTVSGPFIGIPEELRGKFRIVAVDPRGFVD
jgi:hypothetical protein